LLYYLFGVISELFVRKRKLLFAAIAGLLVIAFGHYPVSLYLTWSAKQDLAAAEQKWAAHPLTHYRMVVAYRRTGSINCIQDVEVLNENPVVLYENSCSPGLPAGHPYLQPLSVTDLFKQVSDYLDEVEANCGSHGCPCSGPVRVLPVYDPSVGYPREMRVGLLQVERELDPDYWLNFDCTYLSFNGDSFAVHALTPLR